MKMYSKIKKYKQLNNSNPNLNFQNHEILEIEKENEEEQIQLALFKSLEEINQKKEK